MFEAHLWKSMELNSGSEGCDRHRRLWLAVVWVRWGRVWRHTPSRRSSRSDDNGASSCSLGDRSCNSDNYPRRPRAAIEPVKNGYKIAAEKIKVEKWNGLKIQNLKI